MTNEEAIQKVYDLAVKFLKLPEVREDELDALFKVRELVQIWSKT